MVAKVDDSANAKDVWKLQGKTRDSGEFKGQVAHLVKSVD
jgi:polar amino acid transport system substrate-binding protein